MSKPRSKLVDYKARVFRTIRGFTTEIHYGRQVKHFPDNPEACSSRSVVTVDILTLQRLLETKAGTGRWVASNKELIDFEVIIGQYRSQDGKINQRTSRAIVHYSKYGCHIVPAKPRKD